MDFYKFLQSLRKIMRKDKSCNGDAARIEQLSWIFLLKIFDDIELENETLDSNYNPVIKSKYQWRNWAKNDEGITGNELINFINNDLFVYLKNLKSREILSNENIIRNCFIDLSNYMSNGTLLRQLINKINELDFAISEDFNLFGTIYEEFLRLLQSAGDSGEFYTPRALTKFMVNKINPKINEKIFDPACGTGGFITATIDQLKAEVKSVKEIKKIENNVTGIEAKSLPYILAITNMFLHKLNVPKNINRGNILEKPLRDYTSNEQVDIIITNPPFGGDEIDGIEMNVPADLRTKETAKLFLIYIVELLRNNGRSALILPDGTLSDDSLTDINIKKNLLENCNLHTIVKLPDSVFQPYAGVSTNMLFFEKGKKTEGIWYYELDLPANYKSFSKTKPLEDKHLIDLNKWWDKKETSNKSWYLTINQIIERNYNLDSKNPIPKINFTKSKKANIEIISNKKSLINTLETFSTIDKNNLSSDIHKIDDLFDIEEGSIQSQKNNDKGKYIFVTASTDWKKHDEFTHDCEALILAAKAGGSLGRIHYINDKFIASGLCYILTPKKNKFPLNLKFYFNLFNFIKDDFVYRTKTGTSKKTLDLKKIKNYKILYLSKETQDKMVENFDDLDLIKKKMMVLTNNFENLKFEEMNELFSKNTIKKIWN